MGLRQPLARGDRVHHQAAQFDGALHHAGHVRRLGLPVNRPLWFDFPHDANAWKVTTSYMFGKSMHACPVTAANVTSAVCYLPTLTAGKTWKRFFSKKSFPGGVNE